MPRRKKTVTITSYGIYDRWDSSDKALPKVRQFTTQIQAVVDIEFGLIVNIKGAKNDELTYCIDHPGIVDAEGDVRLPFDGTVYIKTNDWHFYLGDTIWLPIEDKLGDWRMTLELDGEVVAQKTFELVR